ncbi:thioredoxin family protein [uncultured Lacinutrix sp.]|uniref:thioredoxin family protein n=1 Tax=uncultured Lacinutrix sp. TaxID=574032 RepID=UPI00261A1686|nr:thioredoxin family protein [uncultured Lacinutrix sp.]
MKTIKLIVLTLLLLGCKNEKGPSKNNLSSIEQGLIIIDQDYNKAIEVASLQDKLIFIDFYTTWCAPCKKLDKLIFQNDSIKQVLGKDFILLKYNAENDSIFHLSKKHHVSSYPTGLIINKKGYVLNRKYGFPGVDFQSLNKNVLEFTNNGIELNRKNKILKGYSNKIEVSKYPKFYVDYIDRTNTRINPLEINEYLKTEKDIFSEEYFSTLIYFAKESTNDIAETILKNRDKYLTLYGKTDVEIMMYFLTSSKFDQAISEKSQSKYDAAVIYAKAGLSKKWTDDILPSFEKDFLKAQNKWDKVFEINKNLKSKGEFNNEYVNHFCWQVYEDCENQEIIKECLKWMKVVIKEEPTYSYLDTYAYLMYKSGDKKEAKKIALLAIETAKKKEENTESMEKLIKMIS